MDMPPKKARKAADTPLEKIIPWKKRGFSIGLGVRNSHQTKAASRPAKIARAVKTGGEVQPKR